MTVCNRVKIAYGSGCLVLVPALYLQQRCHPGWDRSRTQATHIQYSQTAWALQDRSAAEMGPIDTTAHNYSRTFQAYYTASNCLTAIYWMIHTQILEFRFTVCRISYLFRAMISIPDEAAAAVTTLELYQTGYFSMLNETHVPVWRDYMVKYWNFCLKRVRFNLYL